MDKTVTTLSRRDEIALRIACALIGCNFLIKDADDLEKPAMGIKTQSIYAVEIADAMIKKLDEDEPVRTI